MAVEQREARIVRRKVHFDFLISADHYDILHHAWRCESANGSACLRASEMKRGRFPESWGKPPHLMVQRLKPALAAWECPPPMDQRMKWNLCKFFVDIWSLAATSWIRPRSMARTRTRYC